MHTGDNTDIIITSKTMRLINFLYYFINYIGGMAVHCETRGFARTWHTYIIANLPQITTTAKQKDELLSLLLFFITGRRAFQLYRKRRRQTKVSEARKARPTGVGLMPGDGRRCHT